ncbi:MMPL family transporter [Nannocystis bainbridge]|uniref:MMPL family transporter n=1 Tax=Nannocystis bainbridge TaxID=2995303 RepID=A0ABT5E045_9BACT|nr:MMPL family transporter [Nannocystis bainbridge]MDC0719209.1 MMPL family transporter [Nannocystis bainbridge]
MEPARSDRPSAWRAGIGAAIVAGLAAFCALRLQVVTDITAFMADVADPKLAALSRGMASSELTRTLVLSVSDERGEPDVAIAGARALADRLQNRPEVAWLRTGPGELHAEAIHNLYYPRRHYLLADELAGLQDRLSDDGLRAAARELRRQLGLPTSGVIKQIAPADPLLAYPTQLRRLEAAQGGGVGLRDGHFVAEDQHALVMLATRGSPFDATEQGPLQAAIEAAFAEVDAQSGGRLALEQSGVARFALAAETSMRADIGRISTVSLVGIIALFLLMFRSPRLVLLSLAPLAAGVTAALAACLALFGAVHGLTLAFGATLIGVCIDYSVHLFNHHMLDPPRGGPRESARRIWPGLLLGALTTVAGFAGLAWTSFPGLREVALFASIGVLVAALATRYWLPDLLPMAPKPGWLQRRAAAGLARMVAAMRRRRSAVAVLPAAALGLCVVGLPQIEWSDDVRLLTALDPGMLAEDERVRGRVSRMDGGRFVVAFGADDEAALAGNDAVAVRLRAAQAAGEIEAFRSLHALVWSTALQRDNATALADPSLPARLDAAFVAEGFRAGSFAKFFADMSHGPDVMRPADLVGTPLAEAARTFRAEIEGGEVALVTLLRGVGDATALQARLADLPQVRYFDQQGMMQAAFGRYRARTLELVGFGLFAVLAMVWLRYRKLGLALAAFTPAVLAAATALAVVALSGVTIGILHVVALLLVLSMGVDYGVFLAESRRDPGGFDATVLSVLLACLSTVLAFGLLAMSQSPALQAIGVTVGLGVLLSLVLAPAALVLAGAGEEKDRG